MSTTNSMSDLKSLPPIDLAVLGTGVLAFIVSFFPYWGVSAHVTGAAANVLTGSTSQSVTAWHSYSVLALVLIIIGTALYGVAAFARESIPDAPVGPMWIAAGLCTLGAVLYLIRLFTLPHHSISGFGYTASEGVKWGGYLLLIIVIANAACAVVGAMKSEEEVPWQSTGTGAPPPPAAQAWDLPPAAPSTPEAAAAPSAPPASMPEAPPAPPASMPEAPPAPPASMPEAPPAPPTTPDMPPAAPTA
jgi:Family of unknown function (DUF5336)